MADTDSRILLDWDALEVGETFEKHQYVLTQDMIDAYRQGVMDPEAGFPTISHKVGRQAVQRKVPGQRFRKRPLHFSLLQSSPAW